MKTFNIICQTIGLTSITLLSDKNSFKYFLMSNQLVESGVPKFIIRAPVLPKLIDVAVTFDVMHEHTLGWDSQGNPLDPSFPYNVVLEEPYAPASEADTYDDRVALTQAEQQDRDVRQQQRDNAAARYSGMFGDKGFLGIGGGRLGRDKRRAAKGKLNPYEASALAGEIGSEGMDQWTSGKSADEFYGSDTFEGWDK